MPFRIAASVVFAMVFPFMREFHDDLKGTISHRKLPLNIQETVTISINYHFWGDMTAKPEGLLTLSPYQTAATGELTSIVINFIVLEGPAGLDIFSNMIGRFSHTPPKLNGRRVYAELLEKRKSLSKFRQLKSSPPGIVDFSSNDFLSLATTPAFRDDFLAELQRVTRPVGSTGSRLLDGNSAYAEKLERRIASFHGAEAGLLTNSGFDANVSLFMCLPQPGDIIVYDELIHASVHDGMRQTRAKDCICFKHNDTDDLRQILQELSTMKLKRNIFIAVETVYSMEGDVAPLKEIVALIEELFPSKNCHLIVDEAHATGVYGLNGKGLVSQLGLEEKVFARLHTFGKALACNGAIILCSEVVRSYLINYARPLIYTTFMSYASLSAISAAYDWLQEGKTVQLADHLNFLIRYLYEQLQQLKEVSDQYPPGLLTIPLTCPNSPIFALVSNQPRILASHCQTSGFLVRAVMPPTVPKGTQRVRVCLHAGNTTKEIDNFVICVRDWLGTQVKKQSPSSLSMFGRVKTVKTNDGSCKTGVLAKL